MEDLQCRSSFFTSIGRLLMIDIGEYPVAFALSAHCRCSHVLRAFEQMVLGSQASLKRRRHFLKPKKQSKNTVFRKISFKR